MLGTSRQPKRSHRVRPIAPYTPLDWQVKPWQDKSRVVLLTGSAGGGKSRLAAEKLHGYCLKYPGATALVVRKAKVSMSGGTILFLRRKIIGDDPSVRWVDSPKFRFEYRNGSVAQMFGLFDEEARSNLRSIGQDGAVDFVWMEEGTQFEEEDFNALLGRLRGKAAPWRQIVISCNPDAPTHWIKRRLIDGGEAAVYYSKAQDNFHNPNDYQDTLSKLTGIDALRLREGQWAQAQGIVYDTWSDGDDSSNVTERAEYRPDGGPVYWFLDDGYSGGSAVGNAGKDPQGWYVANAHPRVFLLAQLRADGQVAIFAESYGCLRLSDEHIAEVAALPYDDPEYVIHGPGSAEIRGRIFEAELMPAQGAPRVEDSIKELRRRLAPDAKGWRGVIVHPRCVHFRREMATYAYDPATGNPVKAFDHGPDALRVGMWVLRGQL